MSLDISNKGSNILREGRSAPLSRRKALGVALVPLFVRPTVAAPLIDNGEFVVYRAEKKNYQLQTPRSWQQTDKAGADTLFKVPDAKGTDLGVTITPVRISSLDQLGTLQSIGDKLVSTEKQKESTKLAELRSSKVRQGKSGTTFYSYDYVISTTRGDKRVLATVGLSDRKLYIVNGRVGCTGESCDLDSPLLQEMRNSVDSFDLNLS